MALCGQLKHFFCTSTQKQTDSCPGTARLEYTSSIRGCLLHRYVSTLLHQPGLLNRPQCYQFPWRRFNSHVLLHHHQLSGLETTLRPSVTPTALVSRQIRSRHQHRCPPSFDASLVLLILAIGYPSHSRKHELVFRNVRRNSDFCHDLVLREGQTRVYRTSRSDETVRVK